MFGRYRDYNAKDLSKWVRRKLALPFYLGNRYQCPACGARLRRFLPIWKSFPRKLREAGFPYPLAAFETFNAQAFLCPSCNCSDRERLYALYLRDWVASHRQDERHVIVEFAPSLALSTWIRAVRTVQYRSADLFRRNVDDKVDITNMPGYESDSIDVVICSHVLEHIPDDRAALRELYRILKPGGFGIVMVPLMVGVTETHEDDTITAPVLRWKHFGQDDHVRLYGTADFARRIAETGAEVMRLGKEHFGADAFQQAGIADNSVLYIMKKPGTAATMPSARYG
ncbi:MAG TPA: methyltransferase domain-containing protein [Burkholderiales bacterium]|nr:methyltransferase domain-containing protein [Burkholderiales bacterium]